MNARDVRHRRSIRLKGTDYSQNIACFITICTHRRDLLFGEVVDGRMYLNEIGQVVEEEWLRTRSIRPNIELDAYIVMPNHLHGVLVVAERDDREGVSQYAPTEAPPSFRSPSQTIGAIVRGFKGSTTKQVNEVRGTPGSLVWQRNYYEHIIRDEEDMNRIQEYILGNPATWPEDENHPSRWRRPVS